MGLFTHSRVPDIAEEFRPQSSSSSSESHRYGSNGSSDSSLPPSDASDMRSSASVVHPSRSDTVAAQILMLNSDPLLTCTDAVHVRFQDRDTIGDRRVFVCHTCRAPFKADSLASVMEHFVQHPAALPDEAFHSACLYCQGKVHRYELDASVKRPIDDARPRYYHDCRRWRSGLDR